MGFGRSDSSSFSISRRFCFSSRSNDAQLTADNAEDDSTDHGECIDEPPDLGDGGAVWKRTPPLPPMDAPAEGDTLSRSPPRADDDDDDDDDGGEKGGRCSCCAAPLLPGSTWPQIGLSETLSDARTELLWRPSKDGVSVSSGIDELEKLSASLS